MATLDKPLGSVLDRDDEVLIAQHFWQKDLRNERIQYYRSYFDFYSKEMRRLRWGLPRQPNERSDDTIRTLKDLFTVARLISEQKANKMLSLQLAVNIAIPDHEEDIIGNSIDLVLRIWLHLNVRHPELRLLTTNAPISRQNDDGTSLVDLVAGQFPSASSGPIHFAESRLPRRFTAEYLSRACGLKIAWTEFINDHLRLHEDEETKTVQIYHLKLCAFNHLKASGALLRQGPVLPERMLKETIWTLNLLFPYRDPATNAFLKAEKKTFHNDPIPDADRPRDLNEYTVWRERLYRLRSLYMEDPESFPEFWHKRQGYGTRFQTLATIILGFVLAVILGIISSVTAILSTRATLKGLAISEEGLRIAHQAFELQKQVPICPCAS